MKELRKLEKEVKGYEVLLAKYPEYTKENRQQYMEDLELLISFIDKYIKFLSEQLKDWYSINISIFESTERNIFSNLIVQYSLKKYSKEMLKARSLEKRLKKIEKRFIQFKYFS